LSKVVKSIVRREEVLRNNPVVRLKLCEVHQVAVGKIWRIAKNKQFSGNIFAKNMP
jgi:hypothetical protein